jgi:hypothetical protein
MEWSMIMGYFISPVIAAVLASELTYIFSLRHLKQRLERETAIKFLTEHYLPLLGMLERVAYAWYILSDKDTKREINLTDEEAYRIYSEDILKLSQMLESTIKSGAILLLLKINPKIYADVIGLDYLIKCYQHQITQKENAEINQNVIQGIMQTTMELDEKLSKITMPQLIGEYQRIMTEESTMTEITQRNYG